MQQEREREMGFVRWFLFLWFLLIVSVKSFSVNRPPLILKKDPIHMQQSSKDLETFYYDQTLDHFNYKPESFTTFRQKYVVNSKYWGGSNSNSPIFVYFEGEQELEAAGVHPILTNSAPQFQALLVFLEHRYYGESMPFGSKERALQNASSLGYLNSAQALADFAEIIVHLKRNLSAEHCPVIVYGGSYAGMLASWFRLKYPHLALGAWASSAPILYYFDENKPDEYDTIVTKDFRIISESCYETIKKSWDLIDEIGSQPNGLPYLSQKFKTCSPLNTLGDLKDLLIQIFEEAAQYDSPSHHQIKTICNAIDTTQSGSDLLTRISAGVEAYEEIECHNATQLTNASLKLDPWSWQVCADMIPPTRRSTNDTMFQYYNNTDDGYARYCKDMYGIPQRPHWFVTEYGGEDVKLVLKRFGSNILFTNGLRDPYSIGGVLENISESVIALTTAEGSHCLDMYPISTDDPDWLVSQKKEVLVIINSWIKQYHADLRLSDVIRSAVSHHGKGALLMSLISIIVLIFLV